MNRSENIAALLKREIVVDNNLTDAAVSVMYRDVIKEEAANKVSQSIVAGYIMKVEDIICHDKKLYIYNSGVYDQDVKIVTDMIHEILGTKWTANKSSGIIQYIKEECVVTYDKINPTSHLCLNNGLFNRTTLEIEPFNKDMLYITRNDITYDPGAECPIFDGFVKTTLEGKYQKMMCEMIGYIIEPGYPGSKIFFLNGEGRNGKGVFLRVIERMFGSNVSATTLERMVDDAWAIGNLYGKLVNTAPDIADSYIKDASIMKTLSGDDRISAPVKYYGDREFINEAKLFFGCNGPPRFKATDTAIEDRCVIVPFNNVFTGKNADYRLKEKLLTCDEISGIFNRAVTALKKVRKDGFQQVDNGYSKASDPVGYFVDDVIIYDMDNEVSTGEVLEAYDTWAEKNNIKTHYSKRVFTGILKNKCSIGNPRKSHGLLYYEGIDLIPEYRY